VNSIEKRIIDYLSGGGLFNPEMANHDAVRELLIDCRAALAARESASASKWGAEIAARAEHGELLPEHLSESAEPAAPRNCPTCDSPQPQLHPAVQFEGEVQPCKDSWHNRPDWGLAARSSEAAPAADEDKK